jgi:hypothetical protein
VENIYHRPIKNFTFDGIIKSDAAIGRLRIELVRLKTLEMCELGYVQRLDIDPQFTIKYNNEKDYYEFTLTVYGTYIGKNKALWTLGIDGTEMIPTQKSKLSELSQGQASQSNQK